MAYLTTVGFYANPSNADYGKLKVQITGFTATDVHALTVVDPLGDTLYSALTDPTIQGSFAIFEIDIPLDASGNFIMGDYVISVLSRTADLGTTLYSESQTYCLDIPSSYDLSVSVTHDCYSKRLVVTDSTSYPTSESPVTYVISRTVTVQHPIIAGTDAEATTTSTDDEVIISLERSDGVAYQNVTYNVIVEVGVTKATAFSATFGVNLYYEYTTFSEAHLIQCANDLCGIISCVNDTIQELTAKACKYGGISNLPKTQADLLSLLMVNLAMYNFYLQCKDQTQMLYYYNQLKSLVDDCDCSASTAPAPIPDSGFVYLEGDSAYQVWLDQGNTGDEDAFFASIAGIGDWQDITEYASPYQASTTDPLRYRLLNGHVEFKGAFRRIIGSSPGIANPLTLLSNSFDPADVVDYGAVPVHKISTGEQVGIFYKDNSDGAWKIAWSTSFNSTSDQRIVGLIPRA